MGGHGSHSTWHLIEKEGVGMKEVTVEKSSPWSKGLQYSDAETLAGEGCRAQTLGPPSVGGGLKHQHTSMFKHGSPLLPCGPVVSKSFNPTLPNSPSTSCACRTTCHPNSLLPDTHPLFLSHTAACHCSDTLHLQYHGASADVVC